MTDALPTFRARVSREDDVWVVEIDGPLPPDSVAATDTPRFSEVATEARDLIADLADLDEDRFRVEWRYTINGHDVTSDLEQYQSAERDFRETAAKQVHLQATRDDARESALATLARAGLSQRAMSEMVGLSQQRVNQILSRARTTDRQARTG